MLVGGEGFEAVEQGALLAVEIVDALLETGDLAVQVRLLRPGTRTGAGAVGVDRPGDWWRMACIRAWSAGPGSMPRPLTRQRRARS